MNIVKLKSDIKNILTTPAKNDDLNKMETTINEIDSEEPEEPQEKESPYISIDIKPAEAVDTESQESIPYAPGSPAYEGSTNSEEYQPGSSSPFVPDMVSETSPVLIKRPQQEQTTLIFNPMTPSDSPPTPTTPVPEEKKTILEVEEKKEEKTVKEGSQGNNETNDDNSNTSSSTSNETKKIII